MSTAPSEAEVVDSVRTLENDYALFRETGHMQSDVYTGRRLPAMPKDLAQKEKIYMLSYDVKAEVKAISAFLLGMIKRVDAAPTGEEPGASIKSTTKKQASDLARAHALALLQLNPYRVLDEQRIAAMLVQPVSLTMLEMGEIDRIEPYANFPFTAYNVTIDGCGWQEKASIPTVFGRHYMQNARDVEKDYSHKKGTPAEDKLLRMVGGQKWDFVSDDYNPLRMPSQQAGVRGRSGPIQSVELMWLADDEWLSLVALNAQDSWKRQWGPIKNGIVGKPIAEGKLIWQGPNPFGRVPIFMASGSQDLNLREVSDARGPFLDELIFETQKLAMIDSLIATIALRKASGRRYLTPEIEALRAWLQTHENKWPEAMEWKEDAIPTLAGKIEAYPVETDPMLMQMSERIERKIQEYKASGFTALLNPQVVKDSTAANWQGSWNAGIQKLSPLIGRMDNGDRQMLEAIEHATKWLHERNPSLARFLLSGNGPWLRAAGKSVKDGGATVLDFALLDFPHEIVVESRSVTVTEQQQALAMVYQRAAPLPNGMPGAFIWSDYWEALGEDDPKTREAVQATEGMYAKIGAPMAEQMAVASIVAELEMETGIRYPLLQQYATPMPTSPAPTVPGDGSAPVEPVVSNAAPQGV